MPAKRDPAAQLSETLLATLEAQRTAADGTYPLTLQRLGELAGAADDASLLLKAAARKPFADRAVAARKREAAAPVALRDDLAQLASSPLLLAFALEARCTPDKPAWPPDKLAAALVPELRQPFADAVQQRLDQNALPAAVGSVPGKSGPLLYLHRMPPPPPPKKPDVALAEKLLLVLEAQRRLGPDSYPVPLRRLAELTDPQAPPPLVQKAAANTVFQGRAVVARPKDADAPAALRVDVLQLASSPQLLEFALGVACTPRRPAVPPEKLPDLLVPELRQPFAEAVRRCLGENALPPAVGSVPGKTGPMLYLQRMPPPRKPEAVLADKLVAVLTARRQQGGTAYPLTLRQLLQLADPAAAPAVVKKALAGETVRGQVVLAVKANPDTPLALAADAGRLATSPLLLEFLLQATRTPANHAAPVSDLQKKLAPELRQPFAEAAGRQLPPTVGCVLHKGKRLFFLLGDVSVATGGPPVAEQAAGGPPAATEDFRSAFDEAFDRLQRRPGAEDFVSLLDLRRALPAFDRAAFDAGLGRLRAAGAYSLRLADGRFGISPEERDAGVPTPDGALLLYVSRNAP
jgi:hypothetical protein